MSNLHTDEYSWKILRLLSYDKQGSLRNILEILSRYRREILSRQDELDKIIPFLLSILDKKQTYGRIYKFVRIYLVFKQHENLSQHKVHKRLNEFEIT